MPPTSILAPAKAAKPQIGKEAGAHTGAAEPVVVKPELPKKPQTGAGGPGGEPGGPRQGNDACPATVIPSLPYTDTGTTVGMVNNYTSCFGNTAPDVIYEYTTTAAASITASLCGSAYDTVLEVRTGGACPGTTQVGCNDDSSACGLQSQLTWTATASTTYYIIVDGFSSGAYTLAVSSIPLCDVVCVGTPEGEPVCHDQYVDVTNGGCNSTPPIFSPIACGETVCGTSGTYFMYAGYQYRDTDWYQIVTTAPTAFTWSATAEFPLSILVTDGTPGCGNLEIIGSATANPCVAATVVTPSMPAGTYWFFVAPSVSLGVPCGKEYEATLTSVPCGPPQLGACCFGDGHCEFLMPGNCTTAGGIYQGEGIGCDPNPCPQTPACPPEAHFSQTVELTNVAGLTSDQAPAYIVYEDFHTTTRTCDVHWWGINAVNNGIWMPCVKDNERFEIAFYTIAGGPAVCGPFTVTPTKVNTGLFVGYYPLYYYSVDLPDCCAIVDGWISILSIDDGQGCWFLWATTPFGNGTVSQQAPWPGGTPVPTGYEQSLCLTGTGSIDGACCNNQTGGCAYVPASECAPGMRFTPNTPCNQLDPPCGLGACCIAGGNPPCQLTDQVTCESAGNTWMGGAPCDPYPCLPPNDDCATCNAETLVSGVPITRNGTNVNATGAGDCAAFGAYPNVWECFTLTTCMDVTLNYCGSLNTTGEPFGLVWLNLAQECGPTCTYTGAGMYDFTACSDGNATIRWLALPPGTYWYPVLNDPVSGTVGNYTLHIIGTTCGQPCAVCPSGGIPEGEPVCYDGYVDATNGGCNWTPVIFSPIACGETICGTSGTYIGETGQDRDTDWYQIVTTVPTEFTWTVTAEFPVAIAAFNGNTGCADPPVIAWATADECVPATVTTAQQPPGKYWFWVGPSAFTGVPCGTEYVATLTTVPCGAATGACCTLCGGCTVTTQANCTAPALWQGAGTTCTPNPCLPGLCPGDMDCNGWVDFEDINPFVLAISDPAAYQAAYPNCNFLNGDCNGDGYVDFDDINPFIVILSGK
jgi:hypothetical protein